MIRFISCIRKLEGVTQEEFREYWDDPLFDDLIRKNTAIFRAKSVAKNLTLMVPINFEIRHARDSQIPFEGVIEYWWEKATDLPNMEKALVCGESKVCLDELSKYQNQFIDIKRSHFFFTEQKHL